MLLGIDIGAIDVVPCLLAGIGTVEVRVELHAVAFAAARHLDTSQQFVPLFARRPGRAVEVIAERSEFGLHVEPGLVDAHQREPRAYRDAFAFGRGEEGIGPRVALPRDFADVLLDAPLVPAVELSEGTAEADDEVQPVFVPPAPRARLAVGISFQLRIAHAGDSGVAHAESVVPFGRKEQVDQYARFVALGEGVAVDAAAGGGGELGPHGVVIEVDGVVARRGGFALLEDARVVAGVGSPVRRVGRGVADGQVGRRRHDHQPSHRPGVEVAEARDVVDRVFVAAHPDVALVVGAELYHSERSLGIGPEHPAGVRGADEQIDIIDRLFVASGGCRSRAAGQKQRQQEVS